MTSVINAASAVPGALATAVYDDHDGLILTLDYTVAPCSSDQVACLKQFKAFWDAVFSDGALAGVYSVNGSAAREYDSVFLAAFRAWRAAGELNLRFFVNKKDSRND